MLLQRLGYLNGSCAIGVGLDHAYHLSFGFHERAIVVKILDHCIEVNLENSLVNLLFKLLRNQVETKRTGALEQNHFIAKRGESIARKEMLDISKELLISYLDLIGLSSEFRSNTNELGDASLNSQLADLSVELGRRYTCLENIAQYERALLSLSTLHEIEGDIERVDIRVVRVVDKYASTLPLFYLQSHGNRLKLWHTVGQFRRRQSKVQSNSCTGDGVLN